MSKKKGIMSKPDVILVKRLGAGFTRRDFAKFVCVDYVTVLKAEILPHFVPVSDAKLIAEALGEQIEDLFVIDSDKKSKEGDDKHAKSSNNTVGNREASKSEQKARNKNS